MSERQELKSAEAAAIFITLLQEDEAADLLAQLQPAELERVGRAMCELGNIEQHAIGEALAGFITEAEQQRPNSGDPSSRADHLQRVLNRALGDVKSESLMARIAPDEAPRSIEIARWLAPKIVAPMIENEHPQAIAVLLLLLEENAAAEVLSLLPTAAQAAVVERVARLGKVSGDAIDMLDQLLSGTIARKFGKSMLAMGGARDAARLINLAGNDVNAAVMPEIEARDAALSQAIEAEMFTFEMLFDLDPMDMGRLLRDVENTDLVNALKGISDGERAPFFAAMSSRAADGVRDEIDLLPKLKKDDVESAQSAIVELARKLRDDGEISMGGDDGDFI